MFHLSCVHRTVRYLWLTSICQMFCNHSRANQKAGSPTGHRPERQSWTSHWNRAHPLRNELMLSIIESSFCWMTHIWKSKEQGNDPTWNGQERCLSPISPWSRQERWWRRWRCWIGFANRWEIRNPKTSAVISRDRRGFRPLSLDDRC